MEPETAQKLLTVLKEINTNMDQLGGAILIGAIIIFFGMMLFSD